MRTIVLFMLAATAAERTASALPRQGSKELRIGGAGPTILGFSVGDGFKRIEPDDGDGITVMGLGGGFGYFFTDQAEVGFRFGFGMVDFGGDDLTMIAMGPFGRMLWLTGPIGFYAEVSPGFQILDMGESVEIFDFGLSGGLEAFVTDTWSLRAGFGYQLLVASEEPDTAHVIGVGWGVGAYF